MNDWILQAKPSHRLAKRHVANAELRSVLSARFPEHDVHVFDDRVLVAADPSSHPEISDRLYCIEYGNIVAVQAGKPGVWARPLETSYIDVQRLAASSYDDRVLDTLREATPEELSASEMWSDLLDGTPSARALSGTLSSKTGIEDIDQFCENFSNGLMLNNRFGMGVELRPFFDVWKMVHE